MNNLNLITKYFYPHRILDVGSNRGEFYHICRNYYPSSYYFLIEGNKYCEDHIKPLSVDYAIELLSDSKKEIEFYLNNKDILSTGASYYRECITDCFSENNLIREVRTATTLDDMFTEDSVFDLIKIDTQGSELDIIKGGLKIINNAKGLLLECSLANCNENAPLFNTIKEYLESIQFYQKEILDNHYYNNELVQIDVLFVKN
jgi:FkbM family methyltransferase